MPHADTREALRQALAKSLDRYLPPGPYRDFYAWAISDANPERTAFTRSIALDQLAVLTEKLLRDLCELADWPVLLEHATQVCLYQVFEVVSDNLALKMFGNPTADTVTRQQLLLEFNAAVVDDIRRPNATPASELLGPLRPAAAEISAFAQSLAPEVHTEAAQRYAGTDGEIPAELEFSVWPGLVANLEAGRDVLSVIAGTRSEWLIRQSGADRYQGVSRILDTRQLPRLERATVGARTIMVVPTLSYFTAGLAELTAKDASYPETVDDGTLLEVLADAALLVRLQNDLGTQLLTMPPPRQAELFRSLPGRYPSLAGRESALGLLARAAAKEPALNRFHKDLRNGEYNIALSELYVPSAVEDGLGALADSVAFYSSLYQRHRAAFAANLEALDDRLDDRRICGLISRFVMFHERMYAHDYDNGRGDYAV